MILRKDIFLQTLFTTNPLRKYTPASSSPKLLSCKVCVFIIIAYFILKDCSNCVKYTSLSSSDKGGNPPPPYFHWPTREVSSTLKSWAESGFFLSCKQTRILWQNLWRENRGSVARLNYQACSCFKHTLVLASRLHTIDLRGGARSSI